MAIVMILQMTRTNDPIPEAESVEFMSGMSGLELTHRRFPSLLIRDQGDVDNLPEHTHESINGAHKQGRVSSVPDQVIELRLVVLDDRYSGQVGSDDHDPNGADETASIAFATKIPEVVQEPFFADRGFEMDLVSNQCEFFGDECISLCGVES
jgi:hypothetical protein